MRPYFEKMVPIGKELKEKELKAAKENELLIAEEEKKINEAIEESKQRWPFGRRPPCPGRKDRVGADPDAR